MSVNDLYRSAILEHNRNPRNYQRLPGATNTARGLNALCGDDIVVDLLVDRDGVITRCSFHGEAGAITLSSASMMTEAIRGLDTGGALALHSVLECLLQAEEVADDVRAELGELAALEGVRRYPSRIRAALLPWAALRAALAGEESASTE